MSEGVNPNPDGEQFTSQIDDVLKDVSDRMDDHLQQNIDQQVANFRVADALEVGPHGQVSEVLHPVERDHEAQILSSEDMGVLAESRRDNIAEANGRQTRAREAVALAAANGPGEVYHGRHRAQPEAPAPAPREAPVEESVASGQSEEPRPATDGLSQTNMDMSDEGSVQRRAAAHEVVQHFRNNPGFKRELARRELLGGDVGAVQQMALAAEHTLAKADKAAATGQHEKADQLRAHALDQMGGAEFAHLHDQDIRKRRSGRLRFWRR